jgi:hypothetical protein
MNANGLEVVDRWVWVRQGRFLRHDLCAIPFAAVSARHLGLLATGEASSSQQVTA